MQAGVSCVLLLLVLLTGCQHLPPGSNSSTQATTKPEPLSFKVTFTSEDRSDPATGRLLLFLSQKPGEPRSNIDWFSFDPVYAIDVTNMMPGAVVEFDPAEFKRPDALAFPKPLGELPAEEFSVQAVLDVDQTRRDWNDGPGNLYSAPMKVQLHSRTGGVQLIHLGRSIPNERPLETNEWIQLVEVKSELLSTFHKRDVSLKAAVLLPHGYNESDRRYPVVYQIPGFSGTHHGMPAFLKSERGKLWTSGKYPYHALHVLLDPEVPLGHSVFANSDNNGPVGDALVNELIPAIEARFRVLSDPRARVVSGHSSGGWSSLWLQVAYPDFFGGCWSTAPDPVDFRHFQTMNIYEDQNGHWAPDGNARAVARDQHAVRQTFTRFNHWEYVTGPGGQLESFNAVFSRRAPNGQPEQMMNKLSGDIDRSVAESWKRYDIRLILEQNWATLGPKLHGKIHIICGTWDNFYLDSGVRGLAGFLQTTDHGGYVQFVPGDHGTMWTDELREKVRNEIAAAFQPFDAPH